MPRSVRTCSSVTRSKVTHVRNTGRNPRTPNGSGLGFVNIDKLKPLKLAVAPICELRVVRGGVAYNLSLEEACERKIQALRKLNGTMTDDQMRHLAIYLVNNEQNFPVRTDSKLPINERRSYGSIRGKAAVLLAQNGYRNTLFIKSLEDTLDYMQNDPVFVRKYATPTPISLTVTSAGTFENNGSPKTSYEIAHAYLFFLVAYNQVTTPETRKSFFVPNMPPEKFKVYQQI